MSGRLTRLAKLTALLPLAIGGTCGLGVHDASARASTQHGWWTATNISAPVAGIPIPVPAAPDVPADGLLVEGGYLSPVAYAAVLYHPDKGQAAQALTLRVALGSATTPTATLELCPLRQAAIDVEQGGPMGDAPAYSCTVNTTATESNPTGSGASFTFDVSKFTTGGALAIAILPTLPIDRVVLAAPDDTSLTLGLPAAPAAAPVTTSSAATVPAAGEVTPGGDAPTFPSDATLTGSPGAATDPRPPATVPAPSTSSGTATPGSFPKIVSTAGGRAKAAQVLVVIGAVVVGLSAWGSAGRSAVRAAMRPATDQRGTDRP